MPFGGLFIAGGLTPKNMKRIENPPGGEDNSTLIFVGCPCHRRSVGDHLLSGTSTVHSLPRRCADPSPFPVSRPVRRLVFAGLSLFMEAYFDKGRVSPFLHQVPVYAVKVEDLGERGAHWVAVKVRRSAGGR
jgi:hypothetical protein